MKLSQKQMGRRISALRKIKGLSQEELAKKLKISRSSLTQIERGNRGIDVLELQQLALVLEFSLDEFMASDFTPLQEPEKKKEPEKLQEIRISVPAFQAHFSKTCCCTFLKNVPESPM